MNQFEHSCDIYFNSTYILQLGNLKDHNSPASRDSNPLEEVAFIRAGVGDELLLILELHITGLSSTAHVEKRYINNTDISTAGASQEVQWNLQHFTPGSIVEENYYLLRYTSYESIGIRALTSYDD